METDKIKELHEMVVTLQNQLETREAGSVAAGLIAREGVRAIRAAVEKLRSEK